MSREDTPCLFYEDSMDPDGMVSASQISSFLGCRRRWRYGYVEGLRRRRERDYLTVGKLCHAGMEAMMRARWEDRSADMRTLRMSGLSAIRSAWDEHMEVTDFMVDEVPDQESLLGRAMDVFDESVDEFDPMRWMPVRVVRDGEDVPALELHFVIPCDGSSGLHGYIDAILEDLSSGQIWCVDYKFRRTLAADDDERFSLQNAVYMMACRRMGIAVAGTMTWQRYSYPSAEPRRNMDGSMSRARIRCTWDRYRRYLEDAGLDPDDYSEMEGKLSDVEMCRPIMEIRSDTMVDRVWSEVVESASREITRSIYSGTVTTSMDPWECRMCSFSDLCQAELRGYDADYVRDTEFVMKNHRQQTN